jgi:hypothetical protein
MPAALGALISKNIFYRKIRIKSSSFVHVVQPP